MNSKYIFLMICAISTVSCAGLLRTPKVYNALITTDENLTPSRAFPVIQPTIHETGIAGYPFGPLGPFRFYEPPVLQYGHHGEPIFRGIPPGMIPREGPLPIQQPEPQINPQLEPMPQQNKEPVLENKEEQPKMPIGPPPSEPAPIPLNELGLPPSLVPLQSFHQPPRHPINLQPYPYNNYPLIYDTLNQYQDHYLPPYGYYPPPGWITNVQARPDLHQRPIQQTSPVASQIVPQEEQRSEPQSSTSSSFDNIKNGSSNKNSEVPDVPPPPLPSGAKSVEDEQGQTKSQTVEQ